MRLHVLLASALVLALVPAASANHTCVMSEIVFVSGVGSTDGCASVGDGRAERVGGPLLPALCTDPIPEVRVLGQQVPGTGQPACVPSVGVPTVNAPTPWAAACVKHPLTATGACAGTCTVVGVVAGCQQTGTTLVVP